ERWVVSTEPGFRMADRNSSERSAAALSAPMAMMQSPARDRCSARVTSNVVGWVPATSGCPRAVTTSTSSMDEYWMGLILDKLRVFRDCAGILFMVQNGVEGW